MKIAILFAFAATLAMSIGSVNAGIYKWVDAQGKTHFSDELPPNGKARTVTVDENTISGSGAAAKRLAETSAKNSAARPAEARARTKVVIYTASWCGYCRKAISLLKQRGVPYSEYDIETSSQGSRDYARLSGQGVPILLIGRDRVDGFDVGQINSLLDAAGL